MPNAPSPVTTTTWRSGRAARPRRRRACRRRGSRTSRSRDRSSREAQTREAQDVAAIGDRDRIGRSARRSAAKIRFGCMWPSFPAGASPQRGSRSSSRAGARRAATRSIRGRSRLAVAGSASRAPRAPAPDGKQLDRATSVLAQLLGVVADAQETRRREHGRRAVADLVVELAADRRSRGRPRPSRARASRRRRRLRSGTSPRLSWCRGRARRSIEKAHSAARARARRGR